MTYFSPSVYTDISAKPVSFSNAPQSTNINLSVNGQIPFASITAQIGTAPTLSSGNIVLPVGYWYYLESACQVYVPTGSVTKDHWVDIQWHDGSSYVGSIGRTSGYNLIDNGTIGRDEKAFVLVDATSASVTLSLQIVAYGSTGLGQINYTSGHYIYAGLGRAIIIGLEAP